MFYWIDFIVSTCINIYLAIQWFIYTDHSLPDLANDPELKQQHDDTFQAESIVSIIFLCLIRLTHVRAAFFFKTVFCKDANLFL
jgi:hypothetical protein